MGEINVESLTLNSSLRAIGYWREEYSISLSAFQRLLAILRLGPKNKFIFVHPSAIPQKLQSSNSTLSGNQGLIAYLKAGHRFQSDLGYSFCRFDCGTEDKKMGCSDLTDGVWVWPEGLSHYVELHNVLLPVDFLNHMEQQKWQVATLPSHISNKVDFSYWDSWCEQFDV